MFKRITIYTALLALFITMWGCDKLIYDQLDDVGGAKVYLSVSYGGAASFRSSVSQPDDPTINEDLDDWEDHVHSLALFVFDYSTGALVASYDDYDKSAFSSSFVIELTPGQRDFYFVANMPKTTIADRDAMDVYMTKVNELAIDLYNVSSNGKGFPMSRVYTNQTVTEGGTVYQPTPFKPDGEDKVLLIRAVAKLEININPEEVGYVKSITLKNAYSHYHLNHDNSELLSTDDLKYLDIPLNSKEDSEGNTYYYAYMPEAIMGEQTWSDDNSKQPINYFVIKNTHDKEFEIPIITAAQDYTYQQKYLEYAKSETDKDKKYNLYRNRRYLYTVKNLTDIEVMYIVKDWTYIPKTIYMGYGYNVEIDEDGKVTITNTIDDCMPHKVTLKALNGANFGGDPVVTEINYGYSSKDDTGYTDEQAAKGYSKDYNLSNIPDSGDYLEIYYNGILVKTLTIKPTTTE